MPADVGADGFVLRLVGAHSSLKHAGDQQSAAAQFPAAGVCLGMQTEQPWVRQNGVLARLDVEQRNSVLQTVQIRDPGGAQAHAVEAAPAAGDGSILYGDPGVLQIVKVLDVIIKIESVLHNEIRVFCGGVQRQIGKTPGDGGGFGYGAAYVKKRKGLVLILAEMGQVLLRNGTRAIA